MKYEFSQKWTDKADEICKTLCFDHVKEGRVKCFVSRGTSTRNIIARIHGLEKLFQIALETEAYYIIELLSEQFDKLSEDEKEKTILHELMHIPHSFGGGFRHHKPYVTNRKVKKKYEEYMERKNL